MAPAFGLHVVAQYSTVHIVDSLIEGTFVALFAALILRTSRHQSAGTRFAVWFSALGAIAVLPFLSGGWWSHHAVPATIDHPALTIPDSWAIYLFAAWAVIAFIALISVGRALWHLRSLRKDCKPLDPATLSPLLQTTLKENRGRAVALRMSETLRVPTALGLIQPIVVFPQWAIDELSAEDLNHVLLHELAHLNRWDDWTNLFQQVVRALFFFHPAVWWIERKAALEREIACDDAVVARTASPRAYAECLANLAEKSLLQRSVALAQAALGRVHQTSLRVAEILNTNRGSKTASWKPAVSVFATFTVACAVFAARAPKLIAFQDTRVAPPQIQRVPVPEILASSNFSAQTPAPAVAAFAPKIIDAKLKTDRPAANLRPRVAAIRVPAPRPRASGMVHLTCVKPERMPVTETLFFVIETQDSISPDRSFVNVQMWRVTVLRQTIHPATDQAPRKTT